MAHDENTNPRPSTLTRARRGARGWLALALLGGALGLAGCHAEGSIGRSDRAVSSGGDDGNRGHGNDPDGHDSDNPGRGRGH